jgi:hypothetical protein
MGPKVGKVRKMRPQIAVKNEKLLTGGVSQDNVCPHTPSMSPAHGDTNGSSCPSPLASWRLKPTNEPKMPYFDFSSSLHLTELNIRADSLGPDREHQFFILSFLSLSYDELWKLEL